jgi:hypothetical protein
MKSDRCRKPPMKSLVMKQSVTTIGGHHSGVTLEGEARTARPADTGGK